MYKYFKPNEIISLDPELVYFLDIARHFSEMPYNITSGFRTKEQNTKAGGVKNSLHLIGRAVDLRCRTSTERARIVSGLLKAGVFEIVLEKTHIHVELPELVGVSKLSVKYA